MTFRLIVLANFFWLASCATVRTIPGPDGSPHHLISCNAIETCYEKATEICGRYTIVNTSTDVRGSLGDTYSSLKLLVKCEGDLVK